MSYIGQSPDTIVSRNSFDEFNYTATNSQTTFTGADTNNNTLTYNPGNVEVFLNGVRLEEADFTATNGTSVVLASGATTGDLISIKAIVVFEVGDAVSKSSGGTFSSNISVTGTVTATNFSGNGSGLTGLPASGISNVVEDTTPQLGGDLDVNNNNITGTGNINVTGHLSVGGVHQLASYLSGSINGDIFRVGSNSSVNMKVNVGGSGVRINSNSGRELRLLSDGDTTEKGIVIISSGNVGVGTESPLAKLDIKGDTTTFDGMSKIYLTDTASNAGSRNWSLGNGGSGFGNLTFAVSAAKDGNAGDATATNAMVITSDGNVGIGQTTPGTSLHIKDAITNPNTISTNLSIPASSNSMMAGPITLNATVTVPSGSTWTIV